MSEDTVDLSQIRGDWDFHSRYVTNAMEQTLKRQNKLWRELKKKSRKIAAGRKMLPDRPLVIRKEFIIFVNIMNKNI